MGTFSLTIFHFQQISSKYSTIYTIHKKIRISSGLWCLTVSLALSLGILGQVWYLITSICDLCTLSYLERKRKLIEFFSYYRVHYAIESGLYHMLNTFVVDKGK